MLHHMLSFLSIWCTLLGSIQQYRNQSLKKRMRPTKRKSNTLHLDRKLRRRANKVANLVRRLKEESKDEHEALGERIQKKRISWSRRTKQAARTAMSRQEE